MDKRIPEQQSLVTIRNTFGENVQFVIPDYQRGYKWTIAEVRKLLEDIHGFSVGEGLEYYCLQNLTLVCDKQNPTLRKVVDGQQRLTTSSIIISYFDYCKKNGEALNIGDLPPLMRDNSCIISFGERKKKTSQPFFKKEILEYGLWKNVNEDIVNNNVWMSREYDAKTIHNLFDSWLECNPNTEYNHSDIFHMFCSAMTVAAFFKMHDKAVLREFAAKFLDEVRFLHNNVEEDASSKQGETSVLEAEVFSKINGFRVPLDGADLLRGIFITDAVDKTSLGGGITEREVRLNEARVKLGLELDEMNAWWQKPRHQKYFRMFVSNDMRHDSFDIVRYPINILYCLFLAAKGEKTIQLEWFEHYDGGISKLYCDIRHFHFILRDWYEDVKLYHYAGFLAGQCRSRFSNEQDSINNLLDKCKKRSDLFKKMKERIFLEVTRPFVDENADWPVEKEKSKNDVLEKLTHTIEDPSYNWYEEESNLVQKVLVLMDVIAFAEPECLQEDKKEEKEKSKRRTPLANHLDPEFFTCQGEDKEHIFPQTPIGGMDRKNAEKLREKVAQYWKLVCETVGKKPEELKKAWFNFWNECESKQNISKEIFPLEFKDDNDAKSRIKWLFSDEEREKETIRRINQFVMNECKIDLNSIGNIVMLDSGINRGYGNKHYTEKRKEIWAKYRERQPVRLHTYRVFAKEFSGDENSLDVWTQSSIKANRAAIKRGIEKFFEGVGSEKEVEQ